jgi:hypothetical protein
MLIGTDEPSSRRAAVDSEWRLHPAVSLDPQREREIERQRATEHGSPRKTGRSRTDTMVFSEGFNVAEEMARTLSDEAKTEEKADSKVVEEPEVPAPPMVEPEAIEDLSRPAADEESAEPEHEADAEEDQAVEVTAEDAEDADEPVMVSLESEGAEDPFADNAAATPETQGEEEEPREDEKDEAPTEAEQTPESTSEEPAQGEDAEVTAINPPMDAGEAVENTHTEHQEGSAEIQEEKTEAEADKSKAEESDAGENETGKVTSTANA